MPTVWASAGGAPHYEISEIGVRSHDRGGQDLAIIDFMKYVAINTTYNGFCTSGIMDLVASDTAYNGVKLLAPEVFVVGKPARELADTWITTYGKFNDRYDVDNVVKRTNYNVHKDMTSLREFSDGFPSHFWPILSMAAQLAILTSCL